MTIIEALEHPYLYDFHNPLFEPDCEKNIKILINDDIKGGIKDY